MLHFSINSKLHCEFQIKLSYGILSCMQRESRTKLAKSILAIKIFNIKFYILILLLDIILNFVFYKHAYSNNINAN